MLVFFTIYAFDNPDDSECYVVCHHKYKSTFGKTCVAFPDYQEDSVNVKQEFRITFLTGFILSIVNLLYAGVCILYFICEKQKVLRTASCCVVLSFLLTVTWMVYASSVIFSKWGHRCRVTYLPQSGKFIFIWLIIVYFCLGFCVLVFCTLCCIMTSKAKYGSSDKKQNDPLEERIVDPYQYAIANSRDFTTPKQTSQIE